MYQILQLFKRQQLPQLLSLQKHKQKKTKHHQQSEAKSYLEKSHWKSQTNFIVTAIESNDCVSVGNALRLIDQRNVIRGDFVPVSGDSVSNMSLRQVLQEHKENKEGLKLLKIAIEKAGYTGRVVIGMDVAASEFYTEKDHAVHFTQEFESLYTNGPVGGGGIRSFTAIANKVWTLYEQVSIAAMDCEHLEIAKEYIQILLKKFPESTRVGRLEGMWFEAKGSWTRADKVYSALLEEHPLEEHGGNL